MSVFAKIFGVKSRKVHPMSGSRSRSTSSSRAARQQTRKIRLHEEQAYLSEQLDKQDILVEKLRQEWIDISHDKANKLKKDAAYKKLVKEEKKAKRMLDKAVKLEDLTESSIDIFSKIENMSDKSKEEQRALKKKYVALQKKFNSALGKRGSSRSESTIESAMKELDDFEAFINEK